jgi:hypothetical protein
MDRPPPEDPILEAIIERAVAPYRDLLPADVLDLIQDAMRQDLPAHRAFGLLLDRLRASTRRR